MASRGKLTTDEVVELFADSDSDIDINEHSDDRLTDYSDQEADRDSVVSAGAGSDRSDDADFDVLSAHGSGSDSDK
jgi:hypothetical protein